MKNMIKNTTVTTKVRYLNNGDTFKCDGKYYMLIWRQADPNGDDMLKKKFDYLDDVGNLITVNIVSGEVVVFPKEKEVQKVELGFNYINNEKI